MVSYRTPLGRARGLGSAKHGTGHFIGQRVSAVALVVLVLWGVSSVLGLAQDGYADAAGWLRTPWHAGPLALLLAVASYHMQIGMRVIIEDYIHKPSTKMVLLILNLFVCWLAPAIGIFSILKVAFSSGGAY
jgi:succinate dehydrogenase / fumarate reductase membrane anchor subunit